VLASVDLTNAFKIMGLLYLGLKLCSLQLCFAKVLRAIFAGQNMEVQVKNCLPCIGAIIDHQPKSFVDTGCAGNVPSNQQ
jgi:hypothetical protein